MSIEQMDARVRSLSAGARDAKRENDLRKVRLDLQRKSERARKQAFRWQALFDIRNY